MNQAEIKIYVDSGSYILLGKYTWCPQSSPSLQHHNAMSNSDSPLQANSFTVNLPEFLAKLMKEVKNEDIHIGISIPGSRTNISWYPE